MTSPPGVGEACVDEVRVGVPRRDRRSLRPAVRGDAPRAHAGHTVLTGVVRDQSHLHGLIERIQELGVELISVNPLPPKGPRMTNATPDTIVLIHGFWVTPRSWEHWIAHYEAKGFKVLAPAYPGFEVEVEALNADTSPIEALTCRDHRAPRDRRRRARVAADPHRATPPAACSPDPARPRLRGRGRGDQLGPHRGRQAGAAVAGQGDLPGAQEPRQPPPRGRLHARAVALRVHQQLQRGGVARAVRALPRPRVRRDLLGQRAGQHPPRQRRQLGRLRQRRPRAAALHLRQRGQPDAAVAPALQRQALQVRAHAHRGQGVRGAAPAAREGGLGGGRRLRAGVGAGARPVGAPQSA